MRWLRRRLDNLAIRYLGRRGYTLHVGPCADWVDIDTALRHEPAHTAAR